MIVPAFNTGRYIRGAIDSALRQTCSDLEVIVVDDGSEDDTADIVSDLARADNRVTLVRQAHAGTSAARNRALQAARGTYVAILDSDDYWAPQKLEHQVAVLDRAERSVAMVYSWIVLIDESDRILRFFRPFEDTSPEARGWVLPLLLYRHFIAFPMMRRDCLDAVGGYDASLHGLEDWDLYLRIAERYEIELVPEYLVAYRQRANSMSSNLDTMSKAHQQILSATFRQHQAIPRRVARWSRSGNYAYMASKSLASGHRAQAGTWFARALLRDPTLILDPDPWRALLGTRGRHATVERAHLNPVSWPDEASLPPSAVPRTRRLAVYARLQRHRVRSLLDLSGRCGPAAAGAP